MLPTATAAAPPTTARPISPSRYTQGTHALHTDTHHCHHIHTWQTALSTRLLLLHCLQFISCYLARLLCPIAVWKVISDKHQKTQATKHKQNHSNSASANSYNMQENKLSVTAKLGSNDLHLPCCTNATNIQYQTFVERTRKQITQTSSASFIPFLSFFWMKASNCCACRLLGSAFKIALVNFNAVSYSCAHQTAHTLTHTVTSLTTAPPQSARGK